MPKPSAYPGFNPAPVEESIRLLRKSTVDYEFRTTLVRELHRPEDLDAIAAWLAGAPGTIFRTLWTPAI